MALHPTAADPAKRPQVTVVQDHETGRLGRLAEESAGVLEKKCRVEFVPSCHPGAPRAIESRLGRSGEREGAKGCGNNNIGALSISLSPSF